MKRAMARAYGENDDTSMTVIPSGTAGDGYCTPAGWPIRLSSVTIACAKSTRKAGLGRLNAGGSNTAGWLPRLPQGAIGPPLWTQRAPQNLAAVALGRVVSDPMGLAEDH
jgi:hypothetical protein